MNITVLQGPSASGKSTLAKKMLAENTQSIRVNRDLLREMLFNSKWSRQREVIVRNVESMIANAVLDCGYDVIVDDTNLSKSAQGMWKHLSQTHDAALKTVSLDTPLSDCIERDQDRERSVGRAVIERQFLFAGLTKFDSRPIVIVDVDGTLAHNDGHRDWYDEKTVLEDKPWHVIVHWVKELSLDHCIVIMSGRHDTCSDATARWLSKYGIWYHHLLMRAGDDNRPDEIIKAELLAAMLKIVPKEQIKMVLDDRPKVIEMWRSHGLYTIPVRGAVDPF